MSANGQNRHARTGRLARKLALVGTGAAVLAMPLVGAATASAATPAAATTATTAAATYPDNLDGWIRESLDIMAQHGIPGTYEGIHRNIMRESSGNPLAINNWDINAINGTASKGLLQVIDPTFQAYHVAGTS
ncbi:Transglycosylase SLT domain-containing protein OS=Streptomyces tendae OX=1932 GN=GUR47_17715 PE=4 SV=1 [Streptomyces tendae]